MSAISNLGLPSPDWRALERRAAQESRFPKYGERRPVSPSAEVDRIAALPRRPPVALDSIRAEALVELMTSRLRRPDAFDPAGRPRPCPCRERWGRCIDRLLPAQAWALYEGPLAGGTFGRIGAGAGKMLLNILMPVVTRPRLAVLLIPSGTREQLWEEYQRVAEHFVVPSLVYQDNSGRGRWIPGAIPVHVVPYSILQRPEHTTLLLDLDPDEIVADEGHMLRHVAGAARGGRFLDHMIRRPETQFHVWSGTLAAKSLRDFAHLLGFALGDSCPVPQHPNAVVEWAQAVDPDAPQGQDLGALAAIAAPGETAREAVRRRIAETRGVVETREVACPASIYLLERRPPPVPDHLLERLRALRAGGEFEVYEGRTDIIPDALALARACQQLACGFFHQLAFPRGEARELVDEWLDAQKCWHRELRLKLQEPAPHLDSPFLCAAAAARFYRGRDEWGRVVDARAACGACAGAGMLQCGCGEPGAPDPECAACAGRGESSCAECGGSGGGVYRGSLPTWAAETWPRWRAVRDLVYRETKVVWLDDYLAADAAEWAIANLGVVWYEHVAFGRRVSELSGRPLHGGGPGAERAILAERGDRSIVASIWAHGTGRDGLQRLFTRALVANPPPSADRMEQLLARLHRQGQDADSVVYEVYRHTSEMREAIDRAVHLARFVEGISGNHQRLLMANCEFIKKRAA